MGWEAGGPCVQGHRDANKVAQASCELAWLLAISSSDAKGELGGTCLIHQHSPQQLSAVHHGVESADIEKGPGACASVFIRNGRGVVRRLCKNPIFRACSRDARIALHTRR